MRCCSASVRDLQGTTKSYFAKNKESTWIPLTSNSSAILSPNNLGKVQDEHISGPWASFTKGALNSLFSAANTLSKRARIVKAKPITLPSVMAKMGFSELMSTSLSSVIISTLILETSSMVNPVASAVEKLERSLPVEKLPPAPVMIMYLTSLLILPSRTNPVNLLYMSKAKAFNFLARLIVIHRQCPLRVLTKLWCAPGREEKACMSVSLEECSLLMNFDYDVIPLDGHLNNNIIMTRQFWEDEFYKLKMI